MNINMNMNMNPKLVASSCLFTIPAYYAYTSHIYGVAMLSIVSLVSSIINHVYCRQTIRNIDTILVNLIGVFYTICARPSYGFLLPSRARYVHSDYGI
jgi:hypothetical protein